MSEAALAEAEIGARAAKRVLVIDGNLLTREGVAEILRKRGFDAGTTDGDPIGAARATLAFAPDVVLVNASTVSLAAVMSVIEGAVVAFGVAETTESVTTCVQLRPAGFLLAGEPITRLFDLIETASVDQPQCPPAVVPLLLRLVADGPVAGGGRQRRLTPREQEILWLLRDGYANKEIAVRLGITTRTVKNHLHHVFDKLHVHSRGEAVARSRSL